MCIGYAKEISAWVCDEARIQREVMMDAWSQAFEDADDATDMSISVLPADSPASSNSVQSQYIVLSPYTVGAT